jgi:hypothetical protein
MTFDEEKRGWAFAGAEGLEKRIAACEKLAETDAATRGVGLHEEETGGDPREIEIPAWRPVTPGPVLRLAQYDRGGEQSAPSRWKGCLQLGSPHIFEATRLGRSYRRFQNCVHLPPGTTSKVE